MLANHKPIINECFRGYEWFTPSYKRNDKGSTPQSLPSVFHCGVGPIRMQLSKILLGNNFIIFLGNSLAFLVVVDAFLAVAINNPRSEDTDRLVRNGTFPSSLFVGSKIRDRIDVTTTLNNENEFV